MERLAEAMGHRHVMTTVRHYVDMAMLERLGVGSRGKLSLMCHIWDDLVRRQDSLSEAKVTLIASFIQGVCETGDDSDLLGVIRMALDDPSLSSAAAFRAIS